jgi:transketolase
MGVYMTIDGNNPDQIREALKIANAETEKPSLIIGKTIMGKGALTATGESYERKCATHGMPLGEAGASFEKSIENLGGNPENPFVIFADVKTLYENRKAELLKLQQKKKLKQAKWEAANPELGAKLNKFFSGSAPEFDYASIVQKDNAATRAASSAVLAAFAGKVENMIVSSADLSNSDKTDGFLNKTTAFKKGDFSGAFLQAGVSELTMACIAKRYGFTWWCYPGLRYFLCFLIT